MSKDLAARYFKENKTSFFFKKKRLVKSARSS